LHEGDVAGLSGEFKSGRAQNSELRIQERREYWRTSRQWHVGDKKEIGAQKLPGYLTHVERWAIFARLDIISHA
jgi:hypothetical protein